MEYEYKYQVQGTLREPYRPSELRPCLHILCWVSDETTLLQLVSSLHNLHLVISAYASTAPAVVPAINECIGFSLGDMLIRGREQSRK